MPTIQEWFNVYNAIAANVGSLKAALEGAQAALRDIQAQLPARLEDQAVVTGEGFLAVSRTIEKVAADHLFDLDESLRNISSRLTNLDSYVSVIAGQDMPTIAAAISVGLQPLPGAMAALEKAMTELTQEASPNLISAVKGYFQHVWDKTKEREAQIKAGEVKPLEDVLGEVAKTGGEVIKAGIKKALAVADPLLEVVAIPFTAAVEAALERFTSKIKASGLADPDKARDLAAMAITEAYHFGELAHVTSVAAEMFQPLKHLGFSQLAAALGDLSGFKEISSTVSRATIGAAITRPMRWWGNQNFAPEIPAPRELEELVHKRVLKIGNYVEYLQMWGFTAEQIKIFVDAVWREPSLRDLGVMLDDASIDESFLADRVRKAGYDDPDAEKLTGALVQRITKTSRATLISAARGAAADGIMTLEEFQQLLEGLNLSDRIVDLEVKAAAIQRQRDIVNEAIATYKTQYRTDVITRSDFAIALATLGLDPDRADLILAAADAARAPQIAREEEAKEKEAIREIQRELVPRYRRLFELGLISGDTYQAILIEAGISPGVAAQAVALDASRTRYLAARSGSIAQEREIAEIISETEEALKIQFRKGLIDLEALKRGLEGLGYTPERVRVIAEQERARAYQPPPIGIPKAEEAKERLLRDLAIQAALNDFRRDRIEALDLFDALVDQGIPEDEAIARINLELSRLPPTTTSAIPR